MNNIKLCVSIWTPNYKYKCHKICISIFLFKTKSSPKHGGDTRVLLHPIKSYKAYYLRNKYDKNYDKSFINNYSGSSVEMQIHIYKPV